MIYLIAFAYANLAIIAALAFYRGIGKSHWLFLDCLASAFIGCIVAPFVPGILFFLYLWD